MSAVAAVAGDAKLMTERHEREFRALLMRQRAEAAAFAREVRATLNMVNR